MPGPKEVALTTTSTTSNGFPPAPAPPPGDAASSTTPQRSRLDLALSLIGHPQPPDSGSASTPPFGKTAKRRTQDVSTERHHQEG